MRHPRRGDDAGLFVVLAQQSDSRFELLLRHLLRAGQQDGTGILDLIEEDVLKKFAIED